MCALQTQTQQCSKVGKYFITVAMFVISNSRKFALARHPLQSRKILARALESDCTTMHISAAHDIP